MKKYFSPIEGGQNHGYTFLQFISSPQRWGTLLVSLLFIALTLNIGQKESLEIISIPLAFLLLIFFGLIFLHLRKWNDLKNHKSR
jgi:amino acid permease